MNKWSSGNLYISLKSDNSVEIDFQIKSDFSHKTNTFSYDKNVKTLFGSKKSIYCRVQLFASIRHKTICW